jgi:peptidoglycan L-alanyl-D-glutamate endopeptidase CwlK
MPEFSNKSIERLGTCDKKLQDIMNEAIKIFDFTVLEGHRSVEDQLKAQRDGKSKVGPERSKHCRLPAEAVDVAPYPVKWEDRESFYFLAGAVMAIAKQRGVKVRWGGNWDMDGKFSSNRFDDLPHFELVP